MLLSETQARRSASSHHHFTDRADDHGGEKYPARSGFLDDLEWVVVCVIVPEIVDHFSASSISTAARAHALLPLATSVSAMPRIPRRAASRITTRSRASSRVSYRNSC